MVLISSTCSIRSLGRAPSGIALCKLRRSDDTRRPPLRVLVILEECLASVERHLERQDAVVLLATKLARVCLAVCGRVAARVGNVA